MQTHVLDGELCRFNKDQSEKEAPQTSKMSDIAVSSVM